jgi:hypothetical protein
MKTVLTTLMLMSFSAFATGEVKELHCKALEQRFLEFYVKAEVPSAESFTVVVSDGDKTPILEDYQNIQFKTDGSIASIEASAFLEHLTLFDVDGKWMGEYRNDRMTYQLVCEETL